jgi:hypothetical protein
MSEYPIKIHFDKSKISTNYCDDSDISGDINNDNIEDQETIKNNFDDVSIALKEYNSGELSLSNSFNSIKSDKKIVLSKIDRKLDDDLEIKYLSEEILRKDELISSLKSKNDVLLKTTLRQAETINKLMQQIRVLNK